MGERHFMTWRDQNGVEHTEDTTPNDGSFLRETSIDSYSYIPVRSQMGDGKNLQGLRVMPERIGEPTADLGWADCHLCGKHAQIVRAQGTVLICGPCNMATVNVSDLCAAVSTPDQFYATMGPIRPLPQGNVEIGPYIGVPMRIPQSGGKKLEGLRITPERLAEGRAAMNDRYTNPSSIELDTSTANDMRSRKAARDARVAALINEDSAPAGVQGPCSPPAVQTHAHRFGAIAADTLKCQAPGCDVTVLYEELARIGFKPAHGESLTEKQGRAAIEDMRAVQDMLDGRPGAGSYGAARQIKDRLAAAGKRIDARANDLADQLGAKDRELFDLRAFLSAVTRERDELLRKAKPEKREPFSYGGKGRRSGVSTWTPLADIGKR